MAIEILYGMKEASFMRTQVRFLIGALLYVFFIYVLSHGVGPVPGLAPLLSFSQGAYANARFESFENKEQKLKGLKQPVSVIFDENQVPHIFAKNEEDLFFAQGYVMATYRLFQMDMMTRAGGATLSEVMGGRTNKMDRFFIHFGLRKMVEESWSLAKKDPQVLKVLQSYTDGINAFISSLDPVHWPVEYKVVQAAPKLFTPIRVIQLLKIMSFNLAARSYDLPLTDIANHLGFKESVDLFPDFFSPGLPFDRFDDLFHDLGGEKDNSKSTSFPAFQTHFKNFPNFLHPVQTNGSNSWVVSKEKTKSGFNVLANDTHLGLKAPSVWFENRLHVEGGLDVYGASFPGAPTVILGFNKDLSWGATNGTIDVVDWFEVEFKSETSNEYLLDGKWVEASVRHDLLRVRGVSPQDVKTLWTEFGPVMHREGKWGLAVRWSAHTPSNEALAFYHMDKASSVSQAKEILKDYNTPIQNFSLADKNHIAVVTAGIYPKKEWGSGRVVGNGTLSKNNWKGFERAEKLLSTSDPREGFAHSANQRPYGSEMKNYLGWDFEEPFRGLRIRQMLAKAPSPDVELFQKMQNGNFNELAFYFFQLVSREDLESKIEPSQRAYFDILKHWDLLDQPESKATSLFYSWFKSIEDTFWKEKLSFEKEKLYPTRSRTLAELVRLKKKSPEKFRDFLAKTFSSSTKDLKEWGKTQPTVFKHVAGFPGFNAMTIETQGSRFSLNSNKGSHGGAWRLVVKMSDPPEAWTQIPGSVEGNPLSPHYSDHIKEWAEGKLRKVQFVSKAELLKNPLCVWELNPR